ncbi:MAG: hypothetical protein AAF597_06760 [Bacteroidota bacterium]
MFISSSNAKTMSFSSNKSPKNNSHRLPEVAERENIVPVGRSLNITIDPQTGDIEPLDQYKVFLKRNLKWQAPPADLLANIHARIDRIKAGDDQITE